MQTNFEELAAGAGFIDVEIGHGDIVARAGEGADWGLRWSSSGDEAPEIERNGDDVRVRQRAEGVRGRRLDLDLTIPAGAKHIRLRTGNGQVDAEGLQGQVDIFSGHGDLRLARADGELKLHTGSGRVEAREVEGRLYAQSGSGDLELEDASGEAELHTGSGQINAGGMRGLMLRAHTGNGEIDIKDGTLREIQARTSNGAVQCAAELAQGPHDLATGHGDIHVERAAGELRLHTGEGSVEVGEARGELKIKSGNGDISIGTASGSLEIDTSRGGIEITSPAEASIRAHSGHGDIHIGEGSVRSLQLETSAGSVSCDAELAHGSHQATSGHGDIDLRQTDGETRVRTGSGMIEVGVVRGRLRAETGSGDIAVEAASGELELKTGAGSLVVQAPDNVVLSGWTGNGDIEVGPGSARRLRVETRNGQVRSMVALTAGEHAINSANGDLLVQLPAELGVHIDAQTGFGQVVSDMPLVRVGRSGSMSFNGNRMVGSIGPGEPVVRVALRTGRGQIALQRSDVPPVVEVPPGLVRAVAVAARPAPIPAPVPVPAPAPIPAAPPVAPVAQPPYPAVGSTVPLREPAGEAAAPAEDRALAVLRALAKGDITVDEADELLKGVG